MLATTLRFAHPPRGYATTASSQATSQTNVPSPEQPTVSNLYTGRGAETDVIQPSSAITAKVSDTFRLTAQPCASADKLPVGIATPADNLAILLETARIQILRRRPQRCLQLEVALAEDSVDEEASRVRDVAAASMLRPIEPRRATNVVGRTTMREIARRKP
jgi:hypothetical protein